MQNEGTAPVALYPGMRVAQLCIFEMDSKSARVYGKKSGSKYNYQVTTTASRWYEDRDLKFFRRVFVQRDGSYEAMDKLEELGKLLEDLDPATSVETDIAQLPPPGAARFVRKADEKFVWAPVPKEEWLRLPASERATIMLERGLQWLAENGDDAPSPLSFLGPQSGADSRIFEKQVQKLKDAICAAHELLKRNPKKSKVIEMTLGVTLGLVTGLPETHVAPGVTELLLNFYAERICQHH
jgi:hypothetical protein